MVEAGVFTGVTKRFHRRGPWVLSGINLDMWPGSRTVIVGGNGSGKSTLLRIAAGVTHPTDGTVARPSSIGYVPERLPGRFRMTASEYLSHMGRVRGLASVDIATRCLDLLGRLDVQPSVDVPLDTLSKGNRQKVMIAQAFLEPTGMLVLDEPLSGLDLTARRALGDLLDEAQSRGSSALVSSHQPDSALSGDRCFRLVYGRLEETDDLFNRPTQGVAIERYIELYASTTAASGEEIGLLPGVITARLNATGTRLTLVVQHEQADGVLSTSIGLGWSVHSVSVRREAE